MIIPVRVPASLKVVLATDRRFDMGSGHPLAHSTCPVCDEFLMHRTCVLVFAGIEPGSRKDGGWTSGAAVAVHADCAGVSRAHHADLPPPPDPAAARADLEQRIRAITIDLSSPLRPHVDINEILAAADRYAEAAAGERA